MSDEENPFENVHPSDLEIVTKAVDKYNNGIKGYVSNVLNYEVSGSSVKMSVVVCSGMECQMVPDVVVDV